MKIGGTEYSYPNSAYCVIFTGSKCPNLPPDAEKTLEYLLGTLSQREADIFLLYFKNEMTMQEIGKKHDGITQQTVRRNIDKSIRLLRHISRSTVLRIGREAHLNSEIEKNKSAIAEYHERFLALEKLLHMQIFETSVHQEKSNDLHIKYDALRMNCEKIPEYNERILVLEEIHEKQKLKISEYRDKWSDFFTRHDVLDMKIDSLNLTTRSFNSLSNAGIKAVKNIISHDDLSTIRGLGRASVRDVEEKLRALFTEANE